MILDDVKSADKGVVILTGKVTIGSSGAVSSEVSDGFSTTKAATGRYTFTTDEPYDDLLFCNVVVDAQTTPSDLVPQIYTGYASNAISVSLLAATTETNPASGDFLHVMLVMRKRGV